MALPNPDEFFGRVKLGTGSVEAPAEPEPSTAPAPPSAGVSTDRVVPASVQASRDAERARILQEELASAQERSRKGDERATGDVQALQREIARAGGQPTDGLAAARPRAADAPAAPSAGPNPDDFFGAVQPPKPPEPKKPGLLARAADAIAGMPTSPARERSNPLTSVKPYGAGDARIVAPMRPKNPSVLDATDTGPAAVRTTPLENAAGMSIRPGSEENVRQQLRARGAPVPTDIGTLQDQGPMAEARPLDTASTIAANVRDATGNPVARGAVAGFFELSQVGPGAVRLAADLTGAKDLAKFAGSAARVGKSIADGSVSDLKGNDKLVADITGSIIASTPPLIVGLGNGPAMRMLFAQSALSEYNTGRNSGHGVTESAARAGMMGAAEVLGERFGFSQQVKLIKGVIADLPSDQMARTLAEMLTREVPGEQLTTALQFLTDKAGPAAQNPKATLEQYLEQAGHTLLVTLGQSGVMGGGPTAIQATRDGLKLADAAIARSSMSPADRAAADSALGQAKPSAPPPRPTEQKAEVLRNLDDFAATTGMGPKAVGAIKKAADAVPLDDLPAFIKRSIQSLAKSGLFKGPTDEQALAVIDRQETDDALAATGDKPAASAPAPAEAAPAATGDPADETDDDTGLSDPTPRITTPVDVAAHAAAHSPTNDRPEPTDAQKEAGNYAKGHVRIAGLDITIENPQGSKRSGTAPDGTKWENTLTAHYGYVKGTHASDGDHSDVFVKAGTTPDHAGPVFVIDQVDPATGKFDEHKTVIGAATEDEARKLYLSNYDAGWKGLGSITQLPIEAYRSWVKDGTKRKPLGSLNERVGDLAGAAGGVAATGDDRGREAGGRVGGVRPDAADTGGRGAGAAAAPAAGAGKADAAGGAGAERDPALNQARADLDAAIGELGDVLGAKPPAAPAPTTAAATVKRSEARGTAKHPKQVMGSRVLALVSEKMGGLDPAWLSEFSHRQETKRRGKDGKPVITWRNPMVSGVGALFRRGGTQDLQVLAELLEAEGYLPPGTVEADAKDAGERAKDLVRAALNREEPLTAGEQQAQQEAAAQAERDAYYAELEAEAAAEAEAERQAITAEAQRLPALDENDDDIPWNTGAGAVLTDAAAMRAMGFTDEEIADAYPASAEDDAAAQGLAEGPAGQARPGGLDADPVPGQARREEARPPAAPGSAAPVGGPARADEEGLILEAQSEQDLREKASREAAATESARRKKAAEQERLRREDEQRDIRARADATVDDFQLGQSADEQLSGMDDLFAPPRAPAPKPAELPVSEPLTDAEVAADPARFDGRTVAQQVLVEATGQPATLKYDGGKALRDLGARLDALRELRACLEGKNP